MTSTKIAGGAHDAAPRWATAALVLADGTVFWGRGVGAAGHAVGEVCFNTSMTGYQEIITDPSYAGQIITDPSYAGLIITFTFPHIGNVGTNIEDIESITPVARGVVLRGDITEPANWRAAKPLDDWLKGHNLPGICGVDTREITRRVRDGGAPSGVVVHAPDGKFDIPGLRKAAQEWPGLDGMDLAIEVTTKQTYAWNETTWALGKGYGNAAIRAVCVGFEQAEHTLERGLEQAINEAAAELVIYLAGADPYEGDRLGRLKLTKAGLLARDNMVFESCQFNKLPVAITMAGGYAPNVDDVVEIQCNTIREAVGRAAK